jgi:PAS domain S-box-containing protein
VSAYSQYLETHPAEQQIWEDVLQAPHDVPQAEAESPPVICPEDWLSMVKDVKDLTLWAYDFHAGISYLTGPLRPLIEQAIDPRAAYHGLLAMIHPDDLPQVQAQIKTARMRQQGYSCTYRIQLSDGLVRHLEDKARPIWDETGKMVGFMGIKQDITATHAAQADLVSREKRYRLLVEDMEVPILIHQAYRVVYANRAAIAAIAAPSPEALIGQPMSKFVPERYRDEWKKQVRQLYQSVDHPVPYQADMVVQRHDGSLMQVQSGGVATRYLGQPAGQLFFIDMTEQRKNLHLLRQSQLRLDLAQEIAQLGAWEYDFVKDELWWSDSLYKIYGVKPNGKPPTQVMFFSLVHPDDHGLVMEQLQQVVEHHVPYVFDYRVLMANGKTYYFHVNASLTRNAEGGPLRLVGVTQDITARKRDEQEIKRLNATLERRVAQRTAALEASNDELRRFAYSVSHDLRAPLRHLTSYSQLLSRSMGEDTEGERAEFLGFIIQASRRMEHIITGLLDYSRLGQHPMALSQVDPRAMIQELWHGLIPVDLQHHTSLRLGALPSLWADSFLLEQVFANLLNNAIKYSSNEAQPEVSVEGWIDGHEVTYCVSDNGIGFDMKYAKNLFQLFQRLPGSEAHEGTGIGLANVKRILDRHEGSIWAESGVGKGAQFFLRLPQQGPVAREVLS